jgi:hypothetical protein
MRKALSMKNLYAIKHDKFQFTGDWLSVYGSPEKNGVWIIYGLEKNGKTWGALLLADYLTRFEKVLYVSAEEGTRSAFQDACSRAKISPDNHNLNVIPYEPMAELKERLKMRYAAKVVFIDNITIYNQEIKAGQINKLSKAFPNVLFIFLAHEEDGEAYPARAKECRKMADIIMHVVGLTMIVSGRCPGGEMVIDEERAALYHGQKQTA